jgi:hypothetical protein
MNGIVRAKMERLSRLCGLMDKLVGYPDSLIMDPVRVQRSHSSTVLRRGEPALPTSARKRGPGLDKGKSGSGCNGSLF